jgi:hypothetical protein
MSLICPPVADIFVLVRKSYKALQLIPTDGAKLLVQFPITARMGLWKPLLQNYLEFLYEGERREEK